MFPSAASWIDGAANGVNQPASFNGSTLHFDASANYTGTTAGTLVYDAENRLMASGSTATFAYDPLGRRSMTTFSGTQTNFVHDGDSEIAEYDASNNLLRRFVPGAAIDEYIAMVTGAGTKTFFHTDKMGSVVAMSDTSGNLAEGPYRYDAYGSCFVAGGGACASGEPFRYTGQRLDLATGLLYYRARYYSPILGFFLQTDPIGYKDNLDLYTYVGNDPTNLADPMGLLAASDCGTGSRIPRAGDAAGCSVVDGFEDKGRQKNPRGSQSQGPVRVANAESTPGDGTNGGLQAAYSNQSTSIVGQSFDPTKWKQIGMITDDGPLIFKTKGRIAIQTSSSAGPLPTNQFWVTVGAVPLNSDWSPEVYAVGDDWISIPQYSSGLTGGATENQFIFQAFGPAGSNYQWTVGIPPQEDANGNYDYDTVKVYVPVGTPVQIVPKPDS